VENKILHGDSLDLLKDMDDNSVDSVVTDPPYGYSFMGKDWDKALPPIDIWKECVRVLKPGGFAFVMSAPRSDVHSRMCLMLEEAGFRIDFTPIAWTYATGFPKAMNIGKMVDKRLGKERKVIGTKIGKGGENLNKLSRESKGDDENAKGMGAYGVGAKQVNVEIPITEPSSDKAKELDGSYGGFQPKPAVEVILVVMKPLSEKSYIDQAMKDGKGVTWLDDVRIPLATVNEPNLRLNAKEHKPTGDNSDIIKIRSKEGSRIENELKNCDLGRHNSKGRFPANLLVQDDVLNNGTISKSVRRSPKNNKDNPDQMLYTPDKAIYSDKNTHNDEGSFSRYYDLDKWWAERIKELPLNVQATYPFIIVPKASKAEKNKGCEGMEEKESKQVYSDGFNSATKLDPKQHTKESVANRKGNQNNHPTVKPISLMSYLVTLGSREDELVLDPFVGSGTTCIAAKLLNRKYIGMEMDSDYVVIAQERIKAHEPEQKQHEFF